MQKHRYELHPARGSSHSTLAELVRKFNRSPILDVGAAEGYLGQLLQGSGLIIDAIEPDQTSAAHARPYYRDVYNTPVEHASLPGQSYGTIVCGDVLEHLVDPVAALGELTRRLAPGGVLLVSLPNIVHLGVRLLVLTGRFPLMDRGPLDRTHLHFFTRSTAEQLLASSGIRVFERHSTIVPLTEIVPARWKLAARLAGPMQLGLNRLLPELFAYQWIFAGSLDGLPASRSQ